ncbi:MULTISPECIES: hypothetical protein [Streptomyces]|uniref:hypothetical protein n=1 Tax=Streptomyces TaxID=1883 RepID=UPI000CF1D241|nr:MULTISPECIES: hypothetical protein [Streptomyces]PPS71984.1 hypothetical protein BV882_20185 [Streptomyces sp. 46]
MTISININDLIATRLTEIAQDAWQTHRVMPVSDGGGRVLDLGTASVREFWYCQNDHGTGICGEPMLTSDQANSLLGMYSVDEPVPDPQLPIVEVELLDEGLGGFFPGSLIHFSDVRHEFQKAQEDR